MPCGFACEVGGVVMLSHWCLLVHCHALHFLFHCLHLGLVLVTQVLLYVLYVCVPLRFVLLSHSFQCQRKHRLAILKPSWVVWCMRMRRWQPV